MPTSFGVGTRVRIKFQGGLYYGEVVEVIDSRTRRLMVDGWGSLVVPIWELTEVR